MLTYNGTSNGTQAENGSPAESLISGDGELVEDPGDSPGTPRDTEEEAEEEEIYSHDTDEDDDQNKRRRDRSNSVSFIEKEFCSV